MRPEGDLNCDGVICVDGLDELGERGDGDRGEDEWRKVGYQ